MSDRSTFRKTYGQLLTIFEASYLNMETDPSNDLRILKCCVDMELGHWQSDIVVLRKEGIAIDGIHRGVAYLRCVKKGIAESALPRVMARDT
jgi:hypothetical protein